MSIFSLVKGGKEHEVFEMRMQTGRGNLNRYLFGEMKGRIYQMKKRLNDNWTFCKFPLDTPIETLFQNTSWTPVDLPHDWMIYDTENLYEQAISCYRRIINKKQLLDKADPDTQKMELIFEGVYMDTTIYLNQKEIFTWKHGYSEFVVDLTDKLEDGDNELLVRNEYHLPNSRWYPGSGIYRDVWLATSHAAHLVHNGTYLSTEKLGKTWEVFMDTEFIDETGDADEGRICHEIFDTDGTLVTSHESTIHFSDSVQVDKQVLTVIEPKLWDIEEPNLYQIRTSLYVGDTLTDSITQNLGIS